MRVSVFLLVCTTLISTRCALGAEFISRSNVAAETVPRLMLHEGSLLDRPAATVLIVVHDVEGLSELPELKTLLADRSVTTYPSTPLAELLTTPEGARVVDTPFVKHIAATTSAECSVHLSRSQPRPSDVVLSWSSTSFVERDNAVLTVETAVATLAGEAFAEKGVIVSEDSTSVSITIEDEVVVFDASEQAEAALLSECALINKLGLVVDTDRRVPLPVNVYLALHGVRAIQIKYGADSRQAIAARHLVSVAATLAIPNIETMFNGRTRVDVVLAGGNCHCGAVAEETTATTRQTLSLRTLRAAAGDETNTANVGGAQILIWLTVSLICLVILCAYLMVAVGIDATKDTLLYFKTSTYR